MTTREENFKYHVDVAVEKNFEVIPSVPTSFNDLKMGIELYKSQKPFINKAERLEDEFKMHNWERRTLGDGAEGYLAEENILKTESFALPAANTAKAAIMNISTLFTKVTGEDIEYYLDREEILNSILSHSHKGEDRVDYLKRRLNEVHELQRLLNIERKILEDGIKNWEESSKMDTGM